MAVAEIWREHGVGGSGQLGGRGGSLARAWRWRRQQHGGGCGSVEAAVGSLAVAEAAAWQEHGVGGGCSMAAVAGDDDILSDGGVLPVLRKKSTLVLTYHTYLPIPRHLIVTSFQLIPDHTQLDPRFQMTPNTAELVCFFLETL